VSDKLFECNEGSHCVEFFHQTIVHIVKQKAPCENCPCEKVLIAYSSINVPHRTLLGHIPDECQEYGEKLCEHKKCAQASISPECLQKHTFYGSHCREPI
jgi:hypothetical protein